MSGGSIIRSVGGSSLKEAEAYTANVSNGSITHASAEAVHYNAGDTHHLEDYEEIEHKNEIVNTIKGVAVFRRTAFSRQHKPDYGFDWVVGKTNKTASTEPYDLEKWTLSGFNTIKKEHAPYFLYAPIGNMYDRLGINSGRTGLTINGESYFVPWFSGLAKDAAGNACSYEMDVFFHIEAPADGTIHLVSSDEQIEVVFSDTGSNEFAITQADTSILPKKAKLTFKDYITEHQAVEVVFFPKTKKQQQTDNKPLPPGTLEEIVVTPPQLMGVLNVYKNSKEYELNVRYVKVYLKGEIGVKGIKEKVVLGGKSLDYTHYTSNNGTGQFKELKDLSDDVNRLQLEHQNAVNDPPGKLSFRRSAESIMKEITAKSKKMQDLSNAFQKAYAEAKAIDAEQIANLQSYEPKLNTWRQYNQDVFAQALVRFNEVRSSNYEEMEIDASQFNSMFDDVMVVKNNGRYYLMDDDEDEVNSGRVRDKIIKSFKDKETADKLELIIYLLPLRIYAADDKSSILLGES